MKKIMILLAMVLSLLMVVSAFGSDPKNGGTLVFGRSGDSVGLDPAYETDGNSFLVCDNIFEALVFYKDESTELEPGLASSWSISPDEKTYTFYLRRGAKFHDGTPFNADAVLFSFGRMMKDRKLKFSSKNWNFPAQDRPPENWVSKEMDDTINSIEAVSDSVVVFRLKRAQASFLSNFGMDFADIISPTAFIKDPKGFSRNPVGTGPFKFVSWVRDDRITLEANKKYWGLYGGPYLDKVIFRTIPENSIRFQELKAGNIHICQFPNPADIPLAERDPNLKIISQPTVKWPARKNVMNFKLHPTGSVRLKNVWLD
jgi:peptide/nickel transport system substrate-binding protein